MNWSRVAGLADVLAEVPRDYDLEAERARHAERVAEAMLTDELVRRLRTIDSELSAILDAEVIPDVPLGGLHRARGSVRRLWAAIADGEV